MTTIYGWQCRFRETGDFLAQKPGGGYNHKITDWQAFRVFAEKHGGSTQVEMAAAWQEPSNHSQSLEEDRLYT